MNKLLVTLTLATAFAASGVCSPAYVKAVSGSWFPTTGGAGAVAVAPSATGNLIIVSGFAFTQASSLTIDDTSGIVWSPVVPAANAVGGGSYAAWYGFAKGATTVNVHFANGVNYPLEVMAEEFSGVSGLDKFASASLPASSGSVTIGPVSPSSNGELLWAIANSGAVTGIGSGYTAGAAYDITRSEYRVLDAASGAGVPYSAGFASNSNGSNTSLLFAAFTPSGTAPAPAPAPAPPPPSTSTGLVPLSPSPAGSYGSSSRIPVVTVDQYGRVTSASTTALSTTPAPAPATPGSSADKDARLDFGAACDGVADDTAAIQNAINATEGQNGSLFIPPGKCKISSTLTINKAITMGGHMGTVCSDTGSCGSQIYYTGSGTAIQVNGFVTRIHFHDLTIASANGQGSTAVGVYLNQVEESGFERVNIGDYGGSGAEKKGFTAAIKTNHFAIGWIKDCNFEDDYYALDVEGGFYASIRFEGNNLYHVMAAVRADGGSSNLNIINNWFESVVYLIYVDSSNARLQGGVIQGNHENTDASSGNCSGLPCGSAKMIEVTTGGGFLSSFFIAGNSINLGGGPTSFFDLASPADHFALIGNQLMGSPGVVFGGSATASVGTLANSMPASLGSATRLSQ